jgi:hypothetical protein
VWTDKKHKGGKAVTVIVGNENTEVLNRLEREQSAN